MQGLKWHWQCTTEDTQFFYHVVFLLKYEGSMFLQYTNTEILHSMSVSCFHPVLTTKWKERSIGILKDSLLQQDARGSLDWRKANLHNQYWWISFDCCHLRSCKSNSPTVPKQPHKIIYTDYMSMYDIKNTSIPRSMQAWAFAKNNPALLALFTMSIDGSNSAYDFN